VHSLLCAHDALVHPAHFEGLPNVVCEAFSAGRPVLLSNVCDHPELAGEGRRALLFDQMDPADIARGVSQFATIPPEKRAAMGLAGREYAEQRLAVPVLIGEYERLLTTVARRA
jgi:glycosyltransferase involved in cell wall biosynthesis